MDIDWLTFVMRWLHITSAIVAGGGTIFMRLAYLPASGTLTSDEQSRLGSVLRSKWMIPLHGAITFLLVSGLVNFIRISKAYELPKWYHMIFGIKFLIALAIFFVAISLSGRSKQAERFRQNARFWLSLNATLVLIIVALSGLLGQAKRVPKAAPGVEVPTATATDDPSARATVKVNSPATASALTNG